MDAYHYIVNEIARRERENEELEHVWCDIGEWNLFVSNAWKYGEFRAHEGGWWPSFGVDDVVERTGKKREDVSWSDYFDLSFDFIGGKTIRQVLMERDEKDVWFEP